MEKNIFVFAEFSGDKSKRRSAYAPLYGRGLLCFAKRLSWRLLPHSYGSWRAVHKRFLAWLRKGVWDELFESMTKDLGSVDILLYPLQSRRKMEKSLEPHFSFFKAHKHPPEMLKETK